MSELIFALVLASGLGAAGLSAAPPALPPETTEAGGETSAPPVEPAPPTDSTAPPSNPPPTEPPPLDPPPELEPPAPRTTLPPGLEPVPFPLDEQPRTQPTPLDAGPAPELVPPQQTSARRSIVDLRDPFDRPPPRPRPTGHPDGVRLLMPDLKDPFAPGLRRVRSQRLDAHVPNDIRDPFRDRPHSGRLPPCVRTTDDGTVVQQPGGQGSQPAEPQCERAVIDLRDPFIREQ